MGVGTGTGAGTHVGRKAAWASGGSFFAGVFLLISGATDILQGIVTINRDAFLNGVSGYAYSFNLTSWGWIHVGLGILVALTGMAILGGVRGARLVGIGLAALNLVAQFMYLPYQPVWSVVGMAISAFVIWALATDRSHYASSRT
jgi:hypothetical protein